MLSSATELMLFSDALRNLAISVTLLLFTSCYKMLTEICFIKCVTQSIPRIICYDHVVIVTTCVPGATPVTYQLTAAIHTKVFYLAHVV